MTTEIVIDPNVSVEDTDGIVRATADRIADDLHMEPFADAVSEALQPLYASWFEDRRQYRAGAEIELPWAED